MKPTCVKLGRGKGHLKDRVGTRKGIMTVVECVESPDGHRLGGMWRCICDCGGEKTIPGRDLRPGCSYPSSCGCNTNLAIAQGARKRGRNPSKATMRQQYHSYTTSQRKWGGPLMTMDEWAKIATQPCHYCGGTDKRQRTAFKALGGKHIPVTQAEIDAYIISINGIDRVDAARGYDLDNIVSCCALCNRMKCYHSVDDFLDKIKDLYEHQHLETRAKRNKPYHSDSPSTYKPLQRGI